MRLYHFRAPRKPERACRHCGIRLSKGAPTHHVYCPKCYHGAMFYRAIRELRQVRP